MNKTNKELFEYIEKSVSVFHGCDISKKMLADAGFICISEADTTKIEAGKNYCITRNGSSLIAFKVPAKKPTGIIMTAAHLDSPTFKIRYNADIAGNNYTRLSVEKYGGMIYSTWLDRPLAAAGRVTVKTNAGIKTMLFDSSQPCCIIPNTAIHMNRRINDGYAYNPATDLLPLYGTSDKVNSFNGFIAETLGILRQDILDTDISLYLPEQGKEFGGLITSPRLDDLQCAFASLKAFINSENNNCITLCALFDNEEVGSGTKQGADSDFLYNTLLRIVSDFDMRQTDLNGIIANGLLVSCDNAHAEHPNHPEYADTTNRPVLNGGVVIKYNANQKYTTDAVSGAVFKIAAARANIPLQTYTNRGDIAGGSTLGNIANTHVSVNTVDIGLPQLAMHSALETAGSEDTESLIKVLTEIFKLSLSVYDGGINIT